MPKNPVTDPITNQEIAFVHLILAGAMNDRRAAKAAGLNPDSAAYTKAKPRVQAYMLDHRAAVEEKLVNQEVEGLRRLNLSRDQILTRLWELARLSPEATRGSISGQVKAMSMILALEGLVLNQRVTPSQTQSANASYAAAESQPNTTPASSPDFAPEPPPGPTNNAPLSPSCSPLPLNPFIRPEGLNGDPAATDTLDANLDLAGPQAVPSPQKDPSDVAVIA